MSGKFDYYDAVAHVIPGTIACLFLFYTINLFDITLPKPDIGVLGLAGVGLALAYTVGHLFQSIASTLEPCYYFLWGGIPSAKLLERKSRHFSDQQRKSLIAEMIDFFHVDETRPEKHDERRDFDQRLFERAMTLCNKNKLGRVEAFVAIYGFHRVLLTTFLISFLTYATIWLMQIRRWLDLPSDKILLLKFLVLLSGVGSTIEIFRARKRAYHYAREVLWMTAEYIRASRSEQKGAGAVPN